MKKAKEKLSKIDQLFVFAQRKLSISNCSVKKMKEYLKKKGGTKKETHEVILKLKKYSFLDEDEVVKAVLEYADAKHYGYNKILEMLRQKEMEPKKVAKILKDDSRELRESKEMLKRLVKRYKKKNTANLKQSVYSALIRYGFDENIAIMRASEVYNSPQEEINVLILDYNKLISSYARNCKGSELTRKIIDKLLTKGYKLDDIRKVVKK